MNNELMIDLIADALANFDDWDIVKDLKTSFNEAILLNDPKFDQQLLNRIYDNFMRIPTVDRYNMNFNHKSFVIKQIELYNLEKN
jgi:hypothetical protein